ncbi:MAG: hypothetical protein RLZ09_512, partial [Pseudomonadota bacterium]
MGNFYFYTGIHELSRDFLKSFGSYIYELSRTEYVKFEENPTPVCLAYVDKFYSSRVTTTTQADRDTAAKHKEEFVRVVKIKGFAFETADDIDVDLKKTARNNLLKGM